MKNLFTFFVVLCTTTSLWAYDFKVDNIAYNILGGDSVEVTSKSPKYSGAVTIPATITYISKTYRVTSIGYRAFSSCRSLTSVTISNSVTSIGQDAFNSCISLSSVTIGNSVTIIGYQSFRDCSSLDSITIPNSVTIIEQCSFTDCSSLTSVTIGNSVTRIGDWAFSGCPSLTSINVDAANTHFASEDGVLFNYAKDTLILYLIGNTRTSYTIPNSVMSIGKNAFYGCDSLFSITIPNSVTSIGWNAFRGCSSLAAVAIGNFVTGIGEWAFSDCTSLVSITIPNSVTSIGERAFYKCFSLASINVDAANTHFASEDGVLFNYAKDTLIQYPIGNKRMSYFIPNSVTSMGNYAFSNCVSLVSITIPNSVTSIEYAVFYGCSPLTAITCEAKTPPTCGLDCFGYVDTSIPLYVPAESVSAYQAADVWKDFTNIQAIPATAIENVNNENSQKSADAKVESQKFIHNGHLYIHHNNIIYDAKGQVVT